MTNKISKGRSRNGSGTVSPRETASNKIVYDAWTPPLVDPGSGRKKRFPKRGFTTAQAAQAWINKTVSEVQAGSRIIERRGGGPTVDAIAELWAESSTLKASTIADHLYNYRNMAKGIIGDRPIARVRSTDIDAMFAVLNKRYSPAVLVLLVRALVNFWDYAVRDGKATVNVVKESPWRAKLYRDAESRRAERAIEREDIDGGLIRVFTPEQARTLIELERQDGYRNFWQFILLTGARRGEGLGVRWSDVDFDQKTIWLSENTVRAGGKILTVDTPKGNRRRRIYVPDEVLEVLRAQQRFIDREKLRRGNEWQEHDLVFPRTQRHSRAVEPYGGRYDPKAVSETFRRRCRSLSLPEIKLHGLRHTWASAAYASGVDLKTIQDHLGHRVNITTLVYVHVDTQTKKEATVRVVDWLRAA